MLHRPAAFLLAAASADTSLTQAAAAIAGSEPNGSGKPIFPAVPEGPLEDRLARWNADGHASSPTR